VVSAFTSPESWWSVGIKPNRLRQAAWQNPLSRKILTGFEQDLARQRVLPRRLAQTVRLDADRPPRLGRGERRDDAVAGILTEILLVPEEVELVLGRRLPRDARVRVAPLVRVVHPVLAPVGNVIEPILALVQVRPEV